MKARLTLSLYATLLCAHPLSANGGTDPQGARAAGMANAALGFGDVWSLYHNQAGIAALESFSAGAYYHNRFLVSELAYTGMAAALPFSFGSVGLRFNSFGFSSYADHALGLTYAASLAPKVRAGVELSYQRISIQGESYGNRQAFTAAIGLQMDLSESVMLSMQLSNVTRARLADYVDERIPTVLRMGLSYRLAGDLLAAAEVEKDIDLPPRVRGGLEYRPAEVLYLRVGAASAPGLLTFGAGLRLDKWRFDLASSYHSLLGYSPQVSLTYAPSGL